MKNINTNDCIRIVLFNHVIHPVFLTGSPPLRGTGCILGNLGDNFAIDSEIGTNIGHVFVMPLVQRCYVAYHTLPFLEWGITNSSQKFSPVCAAFEDPSQMDF